MILKTKYFGEIEVGDDEVLDFPAGLFAFEEEKKFVLLPFEGSESTLLCLQSVENEALAFVVMNPFSVTPAYAPMLQPNELERLGVSDSRELCYYGARSVWTERWRRTSILRSHRSCSVSCSSRMWTRC